MSPAPPEPPAEGRELLTGIVERVTFHNEESGFCVLRVKLRGKRDLVTVVGHAASVAPGETVQASGSFANDPSWGPQFRALRLATVPPASAEGMERFLGSGLVRGVGPELARRLVVAFGTEVLDVIESDAARLQTVNGIGPVRARRIEESWAEQRAVREIMLFLSSHGVGTSRAVRIHRTYGSDAISVVKEDPYRLARDIRGIGFVSADAIATRLGVAKTDPSRLHAGIVHSLAEAMDEGHCGLPEEELFPIAEKLLDVPRPLLEAALAHEIREGSIVPDDVDGRPVVFLAGLHRGERRIAERLSGLGALPVPWPPLDAEKATAWVEQRLSVTLAASQREALRLAVSSKLLVVTGGPGVGKTTLVNAILKVLLVKGVKVLLCAPTGRAARRLQEATGLDARTIHRLLEADPASGGFRRGRSNPLDCDLLVVDETSMVDVPLARALLEALPDRSALLLVGDVDQLPSVGPGQVLRDVIDSGALPVVRLTEVFRQAAASRIVVNAHLVNSGRMPELRAEEGTDFFFSGSTSPEEAVRKIIQIVSERIPKRFGLDPVRDVQVLCPMNRGALGAHALNAALQKALNPPGEGAVERYGQTFGPGDKVMQTQNDYDKDVYNGDLGVVLAVDPLERELTVDMDGRRVTYDFGELDVLVLAYATTIHKAQGSEYPAVVIPVAMQHYPMLRRNLLYTGVTRGKRLVVLVGERKALAVAVRGKADRRRYTKLRDFLRG